MTSYKLILIGIITFILSFHFWLYNRVYDMAYSTGYHDGIDKMVMTIDSAFTKQSKNILNGIQK